MAPLQNRLKWFRQQRGWSQDELARRAGVSRPAVSAIESQRLVPSVAAALGIARALECRVEDIFGAEATPAADPDWAWAPPVDPCRFWLANVRAGARRFPAELLLSGVEAHDGVWRGGTSGGAATAAPRNTLVMASCDPAASLLAQAYARTPGFRLLVFQRSSRQALDLLQRGLVDVAGMHLAETTAGNAAIARERLGPGYSLLRYASWQEGLALASGIRTTSTGTLVRSQLRWIGREAGSGARQCQDELLGARQPPRRMAKHHRGLAEAISSGWGDVGVCVRLVCEESGLRFLPVQAEAYDLCFPTAMQDDPRIRALLQVIRSPSFRDLIAELPGYTCTAAGELLHIE